MNGKAIQKILRIQITHALRRIREKMMVAPSTRYRRSVTDEIERTLIDIERLHGSKSELPSRLRAQLLTPKWPPSPESTQESIAAYVEAVALGTPAVGLEELALSTHWPDVMRRLARLAPGPRRKELYAFAAVVEVSTE